MFLFDKHKNQVHFNSVLNFTDFQRDLKAFSKIGEKGT